MKQELKISFLDKVKRPKTGNKFVDRLLTFLIIPLYPIILLFGLLFMVFVGLLSLWQRLTTSQEDLQKQQQEMLEVERQNIQWSIFTSTNHVRIEQQLAGSLPWNSGDYLFLKSNPPIHYLANKLFGDWLLVEFNGVFLQKWNDTRNIDCDLIFIDFDTLQVTELQYKIPTKHWSTEKINADEIKFTFTTPDNDLTFIVSRTEIHANDK